MLWLILFLAGVWVLATLVTVSLCVMARRGDEQLTPPGPQYPADVPWFATLAEPARQDAPAPAPSRARV